MFNNILSELITYFPDRMDYNNIFSNPNLSVYQIEKIINLNSSKFEITNDNWKNISKNPNLTEEFIDEYQNKLRWETLSKNPSLTLKLLFIKV